VIPWSRLVPQEARRALRRTVERIVWPPVEMPTLGDELRSRLMQLYTGEVERLRAMTGKSFPTWSV